MTDVDYDAVDYFRSQDLIDDPFPYFDHLRNQCPVQREPHHDVMMVTGYEEVVAVCADTKTFSAANLASGPFPPFPVVLQGDDVTDLIEAHRASLPMSSEILTMDPPQHTAHRALMMRQFTPKALKATEPFMRVFADRQIDRFVDRGRCELNGDFAAPFALLNICALLGIPEADHQAFLDELLGERRVRGVGSVSETMPDNPFGFLHDRFRSYIEERRAEPRDDVMTTVATTPFPDGSVPDLMEVVRLVSILFVAGVGSMSHLITFALRFVAEDPALQQRLRDQPELIPNFLEETLRLEGTTKGNFRLSRVPTTIGGVDIPAGTTVMTMFSAANRDPRRFENPNDFVVDRKSARQHLAFGHGNHTCAGAALARTEGRVAIERLLARLGDIRISEAHHGPAGARRYDYTPSYVLRGLHELHLEFAPAPEEP